MGEEMIIRIATGIVFLLLFSLLILARLSTSSTPRVGLKNGRLQGCQNARNCVNTEDQTSLAIHFPDQGEQQAWLHLADTIQAVGGYPVVVEDDYLRAEFHSRWFGFIDDLEARIDRRKNVIHLRSASRVGYSDLGVNRRRIEKIRAKMRLYLDAMDMEDAQKSRTLPQK